MFMGKRILLVEDEPSMSMTLTDRLHSEGYAVEIAEDGETAFQRGMTKYFDLIILDLMLPRKSGLDVCRDLRQNGKMTPILMLTAMDKLVDRIVGLKIGADDYLVKPFEISELLARIEAVVRRAPAPLLLPIEQYHFSNIQIDFRRAEVKRAGATVEFSAREFHLLRYLIEHRETVLSREELLQKVWRHSALQLTRTVDVHIASLRQKLEANPRYPQFILTVHGMGYKFIG
jgi:two-component system, OmpR family, alkaline phosphatase synthesis response regulator PhoP